MIRLHQRCGHVMTELIRLAGAWLVIAAVRPNSLCSVPELVLLITVACC